MPTSTVLIQAVLIEIKTKNPRSVVRGFESEKKKRYAEPSEKTGMRDSMAWQ
jgi:hypothetical protein